MPSYLQSLKEKHPRLAEFYSDDEIIDYLPTYAPEEFGGLDREQIKFKALDDRTAIRRGFSAGVDQLQAMGGGLVGMAGDAAGIDSMRDWGLDLYRRNMEEAALSAPETDFLEIDGVGDALNWAGYTIGNLAPMMATSIAGGGAGGILANQATKKTAAAMLKNLTAKGIAAEAAKQEVGKFVAKRVVLGQALGAASASSGMSSGSLYGETEDPAVSAVHGAISGSIDALPVMRIFGRFGVAQAAKEALETSVIREIATQGLAEASTEGVQTLVEQHAKYWVENEGRSLLSNFSDVDWREVAEATAAGALGGGVMGGGASVVSGDPMLFRRPVPQKPEDELNMAIGNAERAAQETLRRGGDALDAELARAGTEEIELPQAVLNARETARKLYSDPAPTAPQSPQTIPGQMPTFPSAQAPSVDQTVPGQWNQPATAQASTIPENTVIDPLIAVARRTGDDTAVARLEAAKRMQALSERFASEGNQQRATNMAERATAIVDDVKGRLPVEPEQQQEQPAAGERISIWTGRRGDGYETTEAAEAGLATRQRVRTDLDWRVERMPSGKYQLSGYSRQGQERDRLAQPDMQAVDSLAQAKAQGEAQRAGQPDPAVRQMQGAAIDRAMKSIELRGGVATQAEADLLAEYGMGAPFDRIEGPAVQPTENLRMSSSGKPFQSEKQARSSVPYRQNPGATVVASGDGFAVQLPAVKDPEQAIAKAQSLAVPQEGNDQEWRQFTPETGTLGVPRETMPQIKAEHRGAMVNFLKGKLIGSEIERVPANTLKPTQAEFSREKVKQALEYKGGNRSILISSDNYVVDGHHQWLANLDGDIQVIRIDAPVQEILDVIKEFPSATSGEAAPAPSYSNDLITFARKAKSLAEVREFARKQFGPRAPQALEQAITGAWNIRNQENRRRIGKDDSLATAVAKLGGIKPEWQQDITGDTKANKMIPGVGQVFSKNGTSPDDMALRLLEEGYITQAEYDNMDGRDTLYEALNEELAGGRKKYKLDSDKAQEEMLQALEDQYAQEEAALKAQREQMYAEIEQKYGAEAADRARLYGDAQDNITDDLLSDIDILNQLNQERDDARETDGEPGITFDEAAGNREPLRDIQGEAQRQPEEAARDQAQDRGAAGAVTSAPAPQAAASSEAVSAPEPRKSDRFKDASGNTWEIWSARTSLIEAFPVVNGVIKVNNQDGQRFATDDRARSANPEARTDFYPIPKEKKPVTPQILSESQFNGTIKIAADSISKLRKVDVQRVLDETPAPFKLDMAGRIKSARPDLAQEVDEIMEEAFQESRTDSGQAKPKAPKAYGESNKLVTKDRAEELRKKLKDKLKNQLNSGIDPEIMAMGAELAAFHIEAGARKFADFAAAVAEDLGVSVADLKRYLRSWYNGARDMMEDSGIDVSGMDSAAQVREQFESIVGDQTNAQRPATDSPADRQAGQEQLFEADPVDGRRGRGGRAADETGAQTGNAQEGSGAAVGERRAPVDRKRGNQPVRSEKSRLEADAAGDSDGSRSLPGSTGGLFDDRETGSDVSQVSAKAPAASPVIPSDAPKSVTPANLSEIKKQMPFLTEGQADDVAFAEKRLSKPDGFGVLFTNGTGTGKTFTGLGIVKRSVMAGRGNILVIAPKQPIVDAWTKAGEAFFGLQINKLDSIRDAGKGVVVTTYANIGDNDELLNRDWDLIVADESHYLSSAGDGKDTKALDRIRELTLKRNTASGRVYGKNRALVDQMNAMNSEAEMMRKSDNQEYWYRAGDIQDKADAIRKQLDAMVDAERERIKGVPDAAKPRAVFLSATPFAYEKSVQWANEFLFDWGTDDSGMGYNSGGNYEKFMMTHFGYRMRYNKLTEPDEKVDRGLMQRAFNSWLKREGVLSGRALDSEFDYDRLFVYADNPIGKRVDDAIDWLREKSGGEKEIPGMQEIYEKMIEENFDYHARMYFLEAIKAREAVPQIKAHLAMGRKVLVMHDFKKGGVSNPFRIGFDSNASEMRSAYEMFREEFSDLINAFDYIPSPISLLTKEFPRALVYNGSIPAKKRIDLQNQFNSDADGSPMMMIAQGDAMREGVSIHDTSGKHPRVMIHLGMPTKPTAAIQQEGRTYRTGQASNAMFRYLTIGSSWERFAFASRIASRASAAENLAMGEQARGLKDAFISAYEEADSYLPGFEGEGTGGKERDAAFTSALTPWDTAKSYYFGTKKYQSGRGARGREHSEFFATPEPVGMKMVQWADIRAGESVLEPSAGLGAIARWFPENARNRAIEFSNDLSSRLALHFEGDLMTGDFMDHNIVNKYDAIVMNPPFGQGGKQAAEHVAKALIHLRDNGRVVALIPTGPAADKQFDKLLYDNKETADIFIVADIKLPSVTFERAGTSVSTRILVLEKQTDKERQGQIRQVIRDYSSAETIEELFDRIEGSSVPPRSVPEQVDETPVTSRTATPVVDKDAVQAAQNSAPEGHWAKGPIIEHTTGKGKVITGVVAKIDFAAAKAIDPYTLKKDGGYFIREKHIPAVVTGISGDAPVFSRSTDTTEFKNWFAGSKVVDANGKPLVVYHGAPDARFASQDGIFKSNRERFGFPEDGSNRAFWFARDAAVAKTYADDRRAFDYQAADPGVIAAFLNIQNPLIIDGNGKTWRDAQQRGKTSDVIEQAKEDGNDGVIITNVVDDYSSFEGNRTGKATDTYVVFSSNQIKSVNNSGAFDKGNPDIRMARARSATAIPIDRAQALISAITGRLENAPETIVVQSMQDEQVPEIVRREDARQRSQGASGEPEGFYYKGKAYIVLDGLSRKKGESDGQALLRVFSHEVLGHAGLRGLFRNDLENVLNEVALKRLADVRKKAAEYGLDLADKSQRMEAAEEVLAEMAQTNPENSIVTKAIEAVRRALRRMLMRLPADIRTMLGGSKFIQWVDSMTDAEIVDRFIVPAREFIRGGNQAGMNAMPAFMRSGPWYRSELQQNIGQIRQMANKQGMIGKDQASQWIDAAIKKGLFKAEEVEWTGLKEFIDMADGRLSVDDIQAFVDSNGVRVQDVTLQNGSLPVLPEGWEVERQPNGEYYLLDPGGDVVAEGDTEAEAIENGMDIDELQDSPENAGIPKYAAYQIPGGVNYREVLLTLTTEASRLRAEGDRISRLENPTPEEVETFRRANRAGNQEYKSSHWSQPNVIAHIRMNDRVDADGNKVLFIEEIQSDWAQAGRKSGFDEPGRDANTDGWTAEENDDGWVVFDPDGDIIDTDIEASSAEEAIATTAIGAEPGVNSGIPKAPFVGNTKSWTSLALKRIIAMAFEGDYDKVAFINGEQSHSRFPKKNNGENSLPGFKSFYDQIIPATLKEISKKMGGDQISGVNLPGTASKDELSAKVYGRGETYKNLPSESKREIDRMYSDRLLNQPGITITDAMREKVASGLPLFSRDMFGGQDDFNLDQYSEEEISQREQMERDRKAQTAKALQKQAADDQLGEFVLTGSDSVADHAAARGQGSLFSRSKALPDTIDIDGVQRPTTNNNGQPIAQSERAIRAFWKWFGNSKMVDDQGRPLVVYHGSKKRFTEFKKGSGGTFGDGIYFAKDRSEAENFGEVIAAYLRIENPADEDIASEVESEFMGGTSQELQRLGFDGINAGWEIVAFDPAQIKSATVNTGEFDGNNSDIRFSRSGATPQTESKEFRDWFKKSKVKNGQGSPLRVYHGTKSQIDSFRPGSWFAEDAKLANTYVGGGRMASPKARKGSNVVPAFLSIQNPLDVTGRLFDRTSIREILSKEGLSESEMLESLDYMEEVAAKEHEKRGYSGLTGRHYGTLSYGAESQDKLYALNKEESLWSILDDSIFRAALQRLGYDGVKADEKIKVGDDPVAIWQVFNSEQVKSAIGNTGTFDPADNDIRFSRNDSTGFAVPDETLVSVAIRKIQDKFKVLKDLQANILKAGGEITEENNAYLAEELFHGKAENDIRQMQEQYIEPLAKKMAEFGITRTELDKFLYARHAGERNARIAEINPEMPDGGSGMTDAEASAELDRIRGTGKQGQYEQLAGIVYDMLQLQRDMVRQGGLESDPTIDAWEEGYQFYVPLKGWAEDTKQEGMPRTGKGFAISGRESKRAMGRSSQAASPTSFTINDLTEKLIRRRKNEVGNAFLKLVRSNPNSEYWQVFTDEKPETQRSIKKVKDPETGEMAEQVTETAVPMAMLTDRYFTTKKNGKTFYIKLEDPRLMKAMKNIGPESNGALIRTMAGITRVMSALNTSYSPEFMVSNFARDVQTALLNLQAEQSLPAGKASGVQIAKKTMKDVPKAMKAIYGALRGTQGRTAEARKWQALFEQFRDDGAKTGWFDSKDLDGQSKSLDNLVAMAEGGFKGKAMLWMRESAKLVENMNQSVENAVRLAAYANALDAGISRKQAASLAKNMTVNFNRRGEVGTVLNAIYMFANASIQGTANFVRTMGTLKGEGGPTWSNLNNAQKIAIGMMAGAYFIGQANRMSAGEDEDDENWYDKVPDYVKERNIVIMKSMFGGPQDGSYWKIPLPYGYNVFYVLGNGVEAVTGGGKSVSQSATNISLAALGSFSPIGFQTSESGANMALKNMAPTVIKPIVEVALNENFMGSSIYTENLPFGTPRPDSALGRNSTPEAYRKLALWLNEVTGGSEYRPGAVDINPDVMQHFLDFFGGSAYAFFGSKIPDAVHRAAAGVVAEENRVPFLSRISGQVLPYADTEKFYQRRDTINQLYDEYRALPTAERSGFEDVDLVRMRPLLRTTERKLAALRKKRDAIYSADMSLRERDPKLKEVEAQMKVAIDRFNKAFTATDQ